MPPKGTSKRLPIHIKYILYQKNKDMKISIITSFFYPVEGGVERHVLEISKNLSKNHQITIHTSDIDRKGNKLKEKETLSSIRIKRYKTWFKIGEFSPFFPLIYKEKINSDIIHIHGYRNPHNLKILLTKKPCIITPHYPNYPKGLRSKINDFIIPMFDKTIGKIILRKCNKIIALHEEEKEWLKNKFKIDEEKIEIISNGIPKETLKQANKKVFREKYKIPKNKILVLCLGRLHKSKGFDQVIKISKYFPEVQFIIIGAKDSYLDQLKNLAEQSKNIKILTDKTEKEKYGALSSADIFIAPSHYEGFGIVVLEAFSQKCAVITSDKGGLPYAVGNAGLIFKDYDIQDLKNKLSKLIINKALRQKLQEEGYERVKNFTWDKISKKIEDIYIKTLKQKQ